VIEMKKMIQTWFQQIRGPFLILSVVLVLVGIGAAHHDGFQDLLHSILLFVGVVLAHVSVNLFNELSDYRTKIDAWTIRTPFSGGSGLLQEGRTSPRAVRIAAYGTLIVAGAIGFYLYTVRGWPVLGMMIVGGLTIRFYTSHLARWLLGELAAGLALGTGVVLGVYYVLVGDLTPGIIVISIPPGILTALLLFLNEFPDAEADRRGGRHHLVIRFGKRKSARIYAAGLAAVYVVIFIAPLFSDVPITVLLGGATLPLAVNAVRIVFKHSSEFPQLIPALGMNVGVVILTDLFLALGFFV
jgi:1,4-dihydroxy-2-naphthoate octaprenyltransferase